MPKVSIDTSTGSNSQESPSFDHTTGTPFSQLDGNEKRALDVINHASPLAGIDWDNYAITWTGCQPATIVYKKAAATVLTITFTYTAGKLTAVTYT